MPRKGFWRPVWRTGGAALALVAITLPSQTFAQIITRLNDRSDSPPPSSMPSPAAPTPMVHTPAPQLASAPAGVAPSEAPYWVRITTDKVNIRTRPDTNSLPVARVDKGAMLRATGTEYGWHRVLAPQGVYCLVSAEFVQMQSESLGLIKTATGNLRVRAGSLLQPIDPLRTEVLTLIAPGTPVRVMGREGEWVKIAPPDGVHYYVFGEYVERVDSGTAERLSATSGQPVSATPPKLAIHTASPATAPATSATTRPSSDIPGFQPLTPVSEPLVVTNPPTTRPSTWEAIPMSPVSPPPSEPALPPVAAPQPSATGEAPPAIAPPVAETSQPATTARPSPPAPEQQPPRQPWPPHIEPPVREEREPVPSDPDRTGFDARGVLLPSFAVDVGDYGLRYKLQDPLTRKISAYVEFPRELNFDAHKAIGRYCGVRGDRYRVAGVGVDIIRVTQVTVVSAPAPQPRLPARDER
ncbi:MAG: SH3 domain-containing protein [Phycisphaerae bacterium]